MIAVPAAAFEQAVDDALAVGARALVGITAGLGELGPEAQARERALVERVRAAGAMLLGPNCLGVFDATSDLGLASNEFPPGSIGLISQSGNLALELGILARAADMGFSRFASVGNQADLDLAEIVASFAAHEGTELIAVYAEDFSDGRAFVDAAAAASTPVVLLTVGRSDASIRAAVSHTGALVSDVSVVEAACRSAGAHLVSTPGEMIDLAQALLRARPLAGPRVAVVGDGGGHGAIACDVAAPPGSTCRSCRRSSPAASRRRCRPPPRRGTRSTSPAAASRTSSRMPASPVRCSSRARSTRCSSRGTSAATASTPRSSPASRRTSPERSPGPWRSPAGRWWPRRCTPTRRPPPSCGPGACPSTRASSPPSLRWPRSCRGPPAPGSPELPAERPLPARRRLLRSPGAARGRGHRIRRGPQRRGRRRRRGGRRASSATRWS